MSDPIAEAQLPIPQNPAEKVYPKAKGICVVLEDDMDKNKIKDLLVAIKQLKGVADVNWINHDGFDDHCNRTRVRLELKKELKNILE